MSTDCGKAGKALPYAPSDGCEKEPGTDDEAVFERRYLSSGEFRDNVRGITVAALHCGGPGDDRCLPE